mgnify:CR=1 FL=1
MSNPTNAIEWLEDSNISINTTLNDILESYADYKLNEFISTNNTISSSKTNLIQAIQILDDDVVDKFSNLLVKLSEEATAKQLL